MEKYLNYDGLSKLWAKTKNQDTLTLNAAKNHTNDSITSAKNELQLKINENSSSITTLNGYFSNGIANKALGDKNGNDITTTYMLANLRGAANGVCPLGSDSKIPSAYLPSYVDDVLEYDTFGNLPTTGEAGKIYVAKDTNKTYRWSGSQYIEISASLTIGTITGTAFDGGKGKALEDNVATIMSNYVKEVSSGASSEYTSTILNEDGKITLIGSTPNYYTKFEFGHFTDNCIFNFYLKRKSANNYVNFGLSDSGMLMIGRNALAVLGDTILDTSMAITDAELEELLV